LKISPAKILDLIRRRRWIGSIGIRWNFEQDSRCSDLVCG